MSLLPEQRSQENSYELLSSTRVDTLLPTLGWNNDHAGPSSFILLPYHLDRLRDAAEQHGWTHARRTLTYDAIKSACQVALADRDDQTASDAFKVRITLAESGTLSVSLAPTSNFTADPTAAAFFSPISDNASLFGPVLPVYIDSEPTPTSLFTSTKTTHRTVYNDARLRVGLSLSPASFAASDVLLYNPQGLITETSIFNVAFHRSLQWVTPPASTGCLPGVLRRWLLEQGRIQEDKDKILTKDSVQEGDWVLLFNGVQGCRLGRITKM
ncbi:aminotransferase [Collybia nuda]|uniref:Aminotransferase n=1 Tax=Collybia nuda TaxID=64659 RepID=A0A9P5YI99_9AGAR|nr:aminotransferase [Collybia nuda]